MYSNKTDIFKTSQCLSREKLVRYHEGKLTPEEQHEVEEHLTDCELCSEALEGIALLKSTQPLDETAQSVSEKYSNHNGTAPSVNKWWYAAAAVVLLIAAGWIISLYSTSSENTLALKQITNPPAPPPAAAVEATPPTENDQPQPLQEKAITSLKKNTAEKNSVSEKAMRAVAFADHDSKNAEPDSISSGQGVYSATAEVREIAEPSSTKSKAENGIMADAAVSQAPSVGNASPHTMLGYKIYNYTYSHEKNSGTLSEAGQGENAKRAKEKLRTFNNIKVENSIYEDMLEKALSDFQQKKYDGALQKFQGILAAHPEDVNALYYSALCYSETGRKEKALSFLDKLDNLANKTFKNESEQLRNKLMKYRK